MFRKTSVHAYFFLGFCSVLTSLQATDIFVEAKAAYFLPTDDRFQKIYSGGGIYGGELTCQMYKKLYGWISADYFSKKGFSTGLNDSTRITMVPLNAGLKFLFPFKRADLYLGIGAVGTYLHIKDHSPFVIQSMSKWGVGGIAKVGAICKLGEHFFADLFTSYTYTTIDFNGTGQGRVTRQDANLSGFAFGLGIGYRFGS